MLHEMSWTEAREYFKKNDISILPVGSNEQHGPQNPLGTDHLIARAIAEETARRTEVLCLQVIPFGVSSHHRQFWGTIFVSPRTFKNYVKDVCLALNYYGVQKIVMATEIKHKYSIIFHYCIFSYYKINVIVSTLIIGLFLLGVKIFLHFPQSYFVFAVWCMRFILLPFFHFKLHIFLSVFFT